MGVSIGQLKAAANSGLLDRGPSTRNLKLIYFLSKTLPLDIWPLRRVLVIEDLVCGVLVSVAGAPGQRVTQEEELHVIEGEGGEPDVPVGPPPGVVGLQGHAQAPVVSHVLAKSQISINIISWGLKR